MHHILRDEEGAVGWGSRIYMFFFTFLQDIEALVERGEFVLTFKRDWTGWLQSRTFTGPTLSPVWSCKHVSEPCSHAATVSPTNLHPLCLKEHWLNVHSVLLPKTNSKPGGTSLERMVVRRRAAWNHNRTTRGFHSPLFSGITERYVN